MMCVKAVLTTEKVGKMKEYVTREYYQGKWVSTHFDTMAEAKKLFRKILKAGGVAICLKVR